MVRMFAEGLETAPLLLDDPFAYWDDDRIERGLPILKPPRATYKSSSSQRASPSPELPNRAAPPSSTSPPRPRHPSPTSPSGLRSSERTHLPSVAHAGRLRRKRFLDGVATSNNRGSRRKNAFAVPNASPNAYCMHSPRRLHPQMHLSKFCPQIQCSCRQARRRHPKFEDLTLKWHLPRNSMYLPSNKTCCTRSRNCYALLRGRGTVGEDGPPCSARRIASRYWWPNFASGST